jgi:hypothetical protein
MGATAQTVQIKSPPAARTGSALSARVQLLIFCVAAVLVISRRPDAIFNAQFFGEDGSIWYPEAYMGGWFHAFWHSRDGYFQTAPRLAAAIALLVPFRFAPLLENLLAIAIQVLPVTMLLSERCREWGSIWLRATMSLLYIALPNSAEVNASMEEAQWHLALMACLLVLASVPVTRTGRVLNICVLVVAGLSGPFVVILLPVAAVFYWFRRGNWRAVQLSIVFLCAVIQLSALIRISSSGRPRMHLGATPELFIRILSRDIYLGAIFGSNALPGAAPFFLLAAGVLGSALIVWCIWRGSLEWKLFVIFCALLFAAALRYPMVPAPQWQILDLTPSIRYWFLPTVGFAWVIAWAAFKGARGRARWFPVLLLVLMSIGIVRDWKYTPFIDYHFRQYARWFRVAPPGTVVIIPINPGGWKMQLIKQPKR